MPFEYVSQVSILNGMRLENCLTQVLKNNQTIKFSFVTGNTLFQPKALVKVLEGKINTTKLLLYWLMQYS